MKVDLLETIQKSNVCNRLFTIIRKEMEERGYKVKDITEIPVEMVVEDSIFPASKCEVCGAELIEEDMTYEFDSYGVRGGDHKVFSGYECCECGYIHEV